MSIVPGIPPSVRIKDQDAIPDSCVRSCTECCLERGPDGGPNVAGMLQKAMCTDVFDNAHGRFELLDCSKCPVHQATFRRPARTADGRGIYWKGSGRQLTQNELLRLEEDGDDITLFCDIH